MKIVKLKQKKYQIFYNQVLVEGQRLIKQISENGIEILSVYTYHKEASLPFLPKNKVQIISKKSFFALASTKTPQDFVAVVERKTLQLKSKKFLLYLDRVSDPGNLGTIIRTALAFDVDGIVLSPGSCDIFNPKVIRASMGAVFSLPILQKPYSWLENQKAEIILADVQGEPIQNSTRKLENIILVMGSEAFGVSSEIKKMSSKKITIPTSKKIESLNLSVATGICLFTLKNLLKF